MRSLFSITFQAYWVIYPYHISYVIIEISYILVKWAVGTDWVITDSLDTVNSATTAGAL